ncbi:MAG: anhydro-N-acetylmuramic acid kinase [Gammaproteobacteria bacterium]
MLYIGLISGTSMDGIDSVLVRFDSSTPTLLASLSRSYPAELHEQLLAGAANPEQFTLHDFGTMHALLAREFAAAVEELLSSAACSADQVSAIGSHGQTILHAPLNAPPFTLQLGDPGALAALTGIPVAADFRSTDMALGGQGAPLMPAFHQFAFGSDVEDRALVNIGGIANLSLMPAQGLTTGFDTGPGNTLLDSWHRSHRGGDFDPGGAWSASGQPDMTLLARLLTDPYFNAPPPKSTGTDYFNREWLDSHLATLESPTTPVDVQATLAELTAVSIANSLAATNLQPTSLAVCGGGAHNQDLLQRLQQHLPAWQVVTTSDWGIAPDWVEAAGFAWLAHERLAGNASSLPAVTGARLAVSQGGLYLPPSDSL